MHTVYNFLKDLCVNNNREWFDENRDRYKEAKQEFESIVAFLIQEVALFDKTVKDLNPKECVFRIFRDTRFSKDKTPYKTNFGAFLVPGGKKCSRAGYYLHIEPDNSFIAGGIHMPPGSVLKQVRQNVFDNTEEFKAIINNDIFKDTFGKMGGDKLKTSPRDFPKDFADIDLLRYKSYTVWDLVSDEVILEPDFLKRVIQEFKILEEFNVFLNKNL